MGVLGQSKDQGAASVAPTATGPVNRGSFWEDANANMPVLGASIRQVVAGPHSTRVGDAIYQKRYYDQIIGALQQEGEQGEDPLTILAKPTNVKRPFRNPYVSGPSENLLNPNYNPLVGLYGGGDQREISQIWAAVQRVRARKPDFLKDFKDAGTIEAMAKQTRTQQQQAAQRVIDAHPGTSAKVVGFAGGMVGSVASLDPENAVGAGFGTAVGKTFARTVIKRSIEGAGTNAATSLIATPGLVTDARRLGQEMTPEDIAHQTAQAAGIGAVFGSAHVVLPKVHEVAGGVVGKVAGKVVDKAASIPKVRDVLVARSIAAGTIDDHRLLNDWMRTHHPDGIVDTSSPDERAAAHTILRDVTAKEISPLHPEAVGANDHRLDAVAQSLGVSMKAPDVPSPAPIQTATVRDRSQGASSPRRSATLAEAISANGQASQKAGQVFGGDAGNGYVHGPNGYKLKVATDSQGGLSLQKRKDGAEPSAFYVGSDGKLLDAADINRADPSSVARIWKGTPEQISAAAEVLRQMALLPLGTPERKALAKHLEAIVTGDATALTEPTTYEKAVHQAEGTGKNPDSSADGHFQFTSGTWLEYAPRVADTKGMSKAQILALRHDLPTATAAERLFRADNGNYLRQRGIEDSPGNLSLAHFLGKADAAKVLRADPSTPIERLVDPASLRANRKVLQGKSASEVVAWAHKRIGAAVDMPVARADAVPDADGLDEADYSETPYERATFKPDELPSPSPDTHIEGEHWDHIQSGEVVLYERANGEQVVVDGNKRLAMAQRLYADDPSIQVHATILREADGISEDMAHAVGALKNVNLGKGSLDERMGSVADMPEVADLLQEPPNVREAAAVAALPYEDFGKVLNGGGVLHEFMREGNERFLTYVSPDNQVVNMHVILGEDGLAEISIDPFSKDANRFGPALMREGAKKLREMYPEIKSFHGERLSGANPGRVQKVAFADKELAHAEAITAGDGGGSQAGEPPRETGSRDAAAEADRILSEGDGPSLFEHAVAARDAAEPFSEPVGDGAKQQTALLDHDLQMDAVSDEVPPLFDLPETGYRLSEEGEARPLKDILDEAQSDELAAKALRECLTGGGEA